MSPQEPLQLNYVSPCPMDPKRPFALIGIALTAVILSAFVGTTTNVINGMVSPTYFRNVMGWDYVPDVWRASVVQGLFEGTVVGLILSLIFTLTAGIISRATCTYGIALKSLVAILLVDYFLWMSGGASGVCLAAAYPHYFREITVGTPIDHNQMLRFAWVGGSIWGAEFGGLLAVILGLVLFWHRRRRMRATTHTH